MSTTTRDAVLARVVIDVLYVRDADTGLWTFSVGNPSILGGACHSREEAERHAAAAIARALGTRRPFACDDGGVCGAFEVDIRPVAR